MKAIQDAEGVPAIKDREPSDSTDGPIPNDIDYNIQERAMYGSDGKEPSGSTDGPSPKDTDHNSQKNAMSDNDGCVSEHMNQNIPSLDEAMDVDHSIKAVSDYDRSLRT